MTKRFNIVAGGIFVLALIALLWFGSNPQNVRRLQAGFLSVISPFLRDGSEIQRKVMAFRSGMETLNKLDAEVKDLRVVNRELAATNQMLRDMESENNRLRAALKYKDRAIFKLTPARIIARDASTWYNSVMIDRGSKDEIKPDMPVLTEEGLVGKTTNVTDTTAMVLLISDENCKVSASVQDTREQGIVKGERTSSNVLPVISLNYLSKNAKLQAGQKVFTSGVGGVFPAGIFIGQVLEYKARQLDGYATLVPAVNLTTLEDVFVVVSNSK